jgi:hypothetical protein
VGVLSRYTLTPKKENWIVVKRVFKYLCGTKYYGICYQWKPKSNNKVNVHVFFYVDWATDIDRWRSTNGYVFKLFSREIYTG